MPSTRTFRRTTSGRRTSTSRTTRRPTSRRTGTRTRSTSRSIGWGTTARSTSGIGVTRGSTSYAPIKQQIEQKIQSFRQLKAQTEGRSKAGRPSPTVLSRFASLVNNGAVVFQVPGSKIARVTRTDKEFTSAATACRILQNRFGKNIIKGVCQSKNGQWLVAASARTPDGRPFRFPR